MTTPQPAALPELPEPRKAEQISDADLLRLLVRSAVYAPETGVFTWVDAPKNQHLNGRVAGCLDNYGYRRIKIGGRFYKAHRLAWLVVYGRMPDAELDHINGDRDDNRIANLRLADRSINTQNVRTRADNLSGLSGASFCKRTQKWRAQIKANKKSFFLGVFETAEDAHRAYLEAKRSLHQGYVERSAHHGITAQSGEG